MGTVKQKDIKNRKYYFCNDIMYHIKTYKDIGIYNIKYITIKKIVKIFTL